jgi:hypothetical protein
MGAKYTVRAEPLPADHGADTDASCAGNGHGPPLAPLLVDAPTAARMLSISPRTLWQLTRDGAVRAVRLGRAVRYDVRDLTALVDGLKGEATP